jgi:hypothetical protein
VRDPGRSTRGAAALLTLLVASAGAQPAATIDAGSFTILDSNRVVGREQFSVVRAPSGAAWAIELRSDAVRADVQWSWRLQVDSAGRPVSARRETRTSGQITARATGAQSRGRFATLSRDGRTEAAREFRSSGRTVLTDPVVLHPLTLAARVLVRDSIAQAIGLDGAPPVVIRRTAVMADSVRIADRLLAARRISARWSDEDIVLWTDPQDRLLAVEWPLRARRAVRDDPPSVPP